MLPNAWEELTLGAVSRIATGGTPSRDVPEYWNGDIPWMSSGEINQRIVCSVAERITASGMDNSSAKLLAPDTIMIALNGQGKTRGKVALLKIETTCNQSLAGIVPNLDKAIPEYLFHFLESRYQEIRHITGDDARNGLNLAILKSIPIVLPPLEEQQRIAEVLRSMDEAIASAKSAHSKAEAVLSQSREVATGLSLESPDWERRPLLDFFQLQRGHDLPVQDRKGGDVPVIASNGTVGFHNVSAAPRPAVVTGRSGTIGKVNYFDGPCWPLNTTLYVKDFKGSYPRYVYHFLSVFPLTDYATGTGVPTLNRNDVHVVEVPWPDVAEQRSIAAALDAIEETVQVAGREIAALMTLKSNVADDLLTGRVRVPA